MLKELENEAFDMIGSLCALSLYWDCWLEVMFLLIKIWGYRDFISRPQMNGLHHPRVCANMNNLLLKLTQLTPTQPQHMCITCWHFSNQCHIFISLLKGTGGEGDIYIYFHLCHCFHHGNRSICPLWNLKKDIII